MSTKIYQAYKIKATKFNDFMRYSQQIVLEVAHNRCEFLITHLKQEVVDEWLKLPRNSYLTKVSIEPEEYRNRIIRWEYLVSKFREKHNQITQVIDLIDLQAGWTVFYDRNFFYFWPWGAIILDDKDYLAFGPDLQDYSYWNNTDRPNHINSRAWAARGRKWNQLLNHQNDLRIIVSTLDFSPMSYYTESALRKMLFGENAK